MATERKNIITRESCKKDLIHMAKADLWHDTVVLMLMLLIFVPLILMCAYVAKYILILGLIFAIICAVAPIIFICRMASDVLTLRSIRQGKFEIVKDTVSRLSKGEMAKKYSEGRHTVDAIYFTKHGRFVSGGTAFDLSGVGDEFYLVILQARTDKICFAFHTLIYEYNDRTTNL
jgi:hypothetical protein